jgi:4-methyl-5(b-hydroxyethyl)-thiazole monophosphate biosynthesis
VKISKRINLYIHNFIRMEKVFIFLAKGFEEIEAVSTMDVLSRGGLNVISVSLSAQREVKGAHGITVVADRLFSETDFSTGMMLILPGGMPGADNLNAHDGLKSLLKQYVDEEKYVAAICAAPLVLGGLGLLQGKEATSYPGYESRLTGAIFKTNPVVKDGNIITSRGPGLALHFGLAILEILQGGPVSLKIAKDLLFFEL